MSHNPAQVRSFIAIELPDEAKRGLARLRRQLERDEHRFVKWVDAKGIHLTLKFLGNVPAGQVKQITATIEEASQGISPFHLEISDLGAFPSVRQPRVLWVGVRGDTDKLSRLQQNIDLALGSLGFPREERPFTPHLTLCRLREGTSGPERRSFSELVHSAAFEDRYPVEVEAVELMRSQLTPAGAIYTCLSVVRLGGQEALNKAR
jgi:2'-5' RNA ligase